MHTLETIGRGKIIAILRGDFQSRESEIVGILQHAGITAVEITLNSADAWAGLARIVDAFGNTMAVGAGTVLTVDDVTRVADVGGRFIVSPNRNRHVIAETKRRGLISIPGCFTPSEMLEALDAGADAVKLFPAVALGPQGPATVKAIRGPLNAIRIVPTGGVTPTLLREYLKAGAWAAGVGSELVGPDVLQPNGLDTLRTRAAALASVVRDA